MGSSIRHKCGERINTVGHRWFKDFSRQFAELNFESRS